jgi:hypothetical protein
MQSDLLDDTRRTYEAENQNDLYRPLLFDASPASSQSSKAIDLSDQRLVLPATSDTLHELRAALSTMQDEYFSLWLGKWPSAIDWTAAVTNTYISATLSSLSSSSKNTKSQPSEHGSIAHTLDNDINKFFAQTTAAYFGEDAFAIRLQAYDDILWVVLEWLESITFINQHSSHHDEHWHAKQFIPAFSHRARVFYQLSEQGWDTRLCGGGMLWNPRLLPYKNAITNQLFIAASIEMYLYYPGDGNCNPFLPTSVDECDDRGPHDPMFLANAIEAYAWLKTSNMTNHLGLYVDGFHISGYRANRSKTVCDERNEMVYTYNQGVILSGLRALWEATGNATYLADAYELLGNVVRATGWGRGNGKWAGLGRNGILTELCDESGRCNQDGQAFKGIYFHHLTSFCMPLPRQAAREGRTYAANREVAARHKKKCGELTQWVTHNAKAAMRTRDKRGRFGGWWGVPTKGASGTGSDDSDEDVRLPEGAVDYGNDPGLIAEMEMDKKPTENIQEQRYEEQGSTNDGDLNDRGRGRTVETQGSGLAVVRAMYEFSKLNDNDTDVS